MHLYVVFQGQYKAAQAKLTQETFQTGVRFICTAANPVDQIGTLPADNEVYPVAETVSRVETNWTIEGNWRIEAGINDLDVGDWLNDQLAPALVTFWGGGLFSSLAYMRQIRVYPIDSTGHVAPAAPYSSGTPVVLTFNTETTCDGGGSGAMLPPQISIVASTRTAQVGRSSRGRMFLPAPDAQEIQANGTFGSTNAGYMAGNVSTFLEAVQIVPGGPGVSVLPAVVPTNWESYALITSVRVGDVYDTQRRRRRAIPEAYSQAVVANPA